MENDIKVCFTREEKYGKEETASDGRKYVTAADGGWRRMDKIEGDVWRES